MSTAQYSDTFLTLILSVGTILNTPHYNRPQTYNKRLSLSTHFSQHCLPARSHQGPHIYKDPPLSRHVCLLAISLNLMWPVSVTQT